MKESVERRIQCINEATDTEQLKKWVCSFYKEGGCPDCLVCKQTEADIDECKDDYLAKIVKCPIAVWSSDFDKMHVQERDKVPVAEIVGIGINCDSCYMYDKCPHYQKGYTCAIDWGHGRPESSSEFMDFLINTQYERVKRAAVFEKIDGGVPDVNLSNEMDRLERLVFSKNDMGRDRLSINVEASSGGNSGGGGGILAKLFGGGNSQAALPSQASGTAPAPVIPTFDEDAEAVEIKPRKRTRRNDN